MTDRPMNTHRWPLLLVMILAALVAGCGSAGGSAAPSPSPGAAPVTTPAEAIARIIDHEPRLAGITQRDSNLIGQAHWYEVTPASGVGVFVVAVRVGWGDCPAGCISEHSWVYAIGPNGEVTLMSEGGAAVPDGEWPSPGAGPAASGGGGLDGPGTGLFITAVAGPTCPVETPDDPACAPRPVGGAVIVVSDGQGNGVAEVELDDTGTVFIELPAGSYVIEAVSVDGFMGAPASQTATVVAGGRTSVAFIFDTGIRAPG